MKYKDIRLLMATLLISTVIAILIESVLFTLFLTKRYVIPYALLYTLSVVSEIIVLYSLLRLRAINSFLKKAAFFGVISLVISMTIRVLNYFIPQYTSISLEQHKILLLPFQAASFIINLLLIYNMFYGLAELAQKINLPRLFRLLKKCFGLYIFLSVYNSCVEITLAVDIANTPALYDAIQSNNILILPIAAIFFAFPAIGVWGYILHLIRYLYQQLNSDSPCDIKRVKHKKTNI